MFFKLSGEVVEFQEIENNMKFQCKFQNCTKFPKICKTIPKKYGNSAYTKFQVSPNAVKLCDMILKCHVKKLHLKFH